MAGHKMHLTCSTICGIGLGFSAKFFLDAPLPSAVLAGCICSLGGIVPDIDSKTSTSFRQCMALISGFSALLLVSRLRDFQMTAESVMVIGALAFLVTWSVLGTILQKFTHHRGMCHSIPMAAISAEIIYLLTSGPVSDRLLKSGAMFLGVLVHLILDEIYSFEKTGKLAGVRVKKSFGTALKMIDFDNKMATVVVYVLLALVTDIVINEPTITQPLEEKTMTQEEQEAWNNIKMARDRYPTQFDMAVVEWVADNGLILEPSSPNNKKWNDLQALFNSQENHNEMKTGVSRNVSEQKETPSLLDQINTKNRKAGQAGGKGTNSVGASNNPSRDDEGFLDFAKHLLYQTKKL